MDWQTGREGNYVLVNGQYQPVLTIKPGQSQRWRVLNATNARYLRLALTGHTLTLIGTDGGLLGSPVPGLDEIPRNGSRSSSPPTCHRQRPPCCAACRTTEAGWE